MSLSPDTHTHATDNSPVTSTSDCAKLSTSQGCAAKYNWDDSGDGGKQPEHKSLIIHARGKDYPLPWHVALCVEKVTGFSLPDLQERSNESAVVKTRQAVSYFLRIHPNYRWTYDAIGALFSRHHTTVMHSVNKAAEWMAQHHDYNSTVYVMDIVSALWDLETISRLHRMSILPASAFPDYF